MKNIVKTIGVLLLVFNCFALSAQIQKEQLVGTWVFNYDVSFKKMEQPLKVIYDDITQEQRLTIEKNYRDRKAIFAADGSYKQILSDGRESIGRWELNKNNTVVEITDPNGNKYIQKIKILTDTELILEPENSGDSKMFLKEWSFIKIKN